MKKFLIVIILTVFTGLPFFAQTIKMPLPEGKIELFDGFEHGNYWIWSGYDYDQWGTHKFSSGADIKKNWSSEGKHSLECKWEIRPYGAWWYSGNWFYDGTQDLSGTKYIAIDVYNPTNAVFNVCLIIQSTDEWKWQQCEVYAIGKGVHTLVYDVQQFSADLGDVRRINLDVNTSNYSEEEDSFFVDNIRLIK